VEHPLRVQGDPRLLRILLENLLGNAWKFTSRTPEASISVSSRSLQTGEIEISICDNGVGFPSAQAGKLFTPFHRLHKQDEFPGTGIGLAIAKRIVSRHGGLIRATGEADRGAAVHFTLPLGKQERP
jgi:signal transduction histidine kinase